MEILTARSHGGTNSSVRRFWLDSPAVGTVAPGAALRIEGWIVAKEEPIEALLVFCQGSLLRTAPVNRARPDVAAHCPGAPERCGFATSLTPLELPRRFELSIATLMKNGSTEPLATITGQQVLPPPAGPGSLQPLMLSSLGRTGTTYVMRLLAGHPQIVADRTYPYETNPATYWMHLLRVLTQPTAAGEPAESFGFSQWPQPPFFPVPRAGTPLLADYLDQSYPAQAAAFCRDAIEGFYRRLAAAQQQPGARFFCEKFLPNGLHFLFWNLYPDAREIFLVRDFRDVVCSILAFNAKRGTLGFGRQFDSSDEAYLQRLRNAALRLLENLRGRRDRAHLVRYEDLITRPNDCLRGIFSYLGLDAPQALLDTLIRLAAADSRQLQEHRTSGSAQESVGRWRRDLPPDLQRLCRETFDDLLPQFGYQLDAQGDLLRDSPNPSPAPCS